MRLSLFLAATVVLAAVNVSALPVRERDEKVAGVSNRKNTVVSSGAKLAITKESIDAIKTANKKDAAVKENIVPVTKPAGSLDQQTIRKAQVANIKLTENL
jgi:nucleoid-associated protein YgaU